MKNVPKKIDILGRKFKIKVQKDFDRDGLCCPQTEVITLKKDVENPRRTLIHELVHGIIFSGGLFEAIDNEKINEIIAEQVARVIDENIETLAKVKSNV